MLRRDREKHSEWVSDDGYDSWVQRMEGEEYGDELVLKALASLTQLQFQPVKLIPVTFPAHGTGDTTFFFGNDELEEHWVYLRLK